MLQRIHQRPLPFLLALLILCGALGLATRGDDPKYSRLGGEALAIALYEDLLAQFPTVQDRYGVEHLFPDDYGGAYLGDDGRLVICATTRGPSFSLPRSQEYTFQVVPYSLNELHRVSQAVGDAMGSFRTRYAPDSPEYRLLEIVTGVGTDESIDRVTLMSSRELSEEEQALLASLFTARGPELFDFQAAICVLA